MSGGSAILALPDIEDDEEVKAKRSKALQVKGSMVISPNHGHIEPLHSDQPKKPDSDSGMLQNLSDWFFKKNEEEDEENKKDYKVVPPTSTAGGSY